MSSGLVPTLEKMPSQWLARRSPAINGVLDQGPVLVNHILALALALVKKSGDALQPPHAGEVFGHPILDILVSPSPTNSLFPM